MIKSPPVSSRETVLLVQDQSEQSARMRAELESVGFGVDVCDTGAIALAFVAEQHPDLILLDMHLPDRSGREILQRLKVDPTLSGIPVILLTGAFREVQDIVGNLKQGADDYLCKPVETGELVARIRNSLRARQTQRELGRMVRLLHTVNQVGNQLTGILDLKNLLDSAVQMINETFAYPYVHVFLRQTNTLVLAAAAGPTAADLLIDSPRLTLDGNTLAAACVRAGRLRMFTPADNGYAPLAQLPDVRSAVAAPLRSAGEITGALEIASPDELAFSSNDSLVLETLADLIGVAVHNSRTYQDMESLATLDPLTGLLNRRTILAQLMAEWARSQRRLRAVALVSIDIDGFKSLNDTHGHMVGDKAMQAVASGIQSTLRREDSAGRLGGDEFLVILPETDQAGAVKAAGRLRDLCHSLVLESDAGAIVPVTISLGVVSYPETRAAEPTDLLRAVDRALYRAKAAGRNQVAE
ncbi:MAG: diguanylate cyclase [Chloroflexota bacterium]